MTVVKCPIKGSYLVGPDEFEPLPIGKTWSNVAVPVYRYEERWACNSCGSVVDTTRQECDHVRSVKEKMGEEAIR